jgi:hypothetical protein
MIFGPGIVMRGGIFIVKLAHRMLVDIKRRRERPFWMVGRPLQVKI